MECHVGSMLQSLTIHATVDLKSNNDINCLSVNIYIYIYINKTKLSHRGSPMSQTGSQSNMSLKTVPGPRMPGCGESSSTKHSNIKTV